MRLSITSGFHFPLSFILLRLFHGMIYKRVYCETLVLHYVNKHLVLKSSMIRYV